MIVCADVGNNGIRIGAWQTGQPGAGIPTMIWHKSLKRPFDPTLLAELDIHQEATNLWGIASVNAPLLKQLTDWLQEFRPLDPFRMIRRKDIPMSVLVDQPDSVGIDRLISAWMSSTKTPGQPAIVVDAGSAVTVDLVDATGRFLGGNIFPGTSACLRSLSESTDQLPQLIEGGTFPDTPFGRSTSEAIRSGVYRMQAAAIVSLVRQLQDFASAGDDHVHLTGSGIPALQSLLPAWRYTGHLVIEGIRELVMQ